MTPKIVNRDEKRNLIAQAAIEVFGEKGFERTRIDDIAKKAGIGKGTVYEYFKDKEGLLRGSFRLLMDNMMGELGALVIESEPPLEQLKTITRVMIRAIVQLGSVYRFFLEYMLHMSRMDQDHPILKEMLQQFRQQVVLLLEEGKRRGEIRQDLASEAFAAAFLAWFDGAIFHVIVLPDTVPLEQMAEQFLDMTLRAVRREK